MAPVLFLILALIGGLLAPWLSPQDPHDPMQLDIMDSELPPRWTEEGDERFLFGTDGQGRDVLSATLHGARTSIGIGFGAITLQLFLGSALGFWAGYRGGKWDAFLMRLADVQSAFSALMTAIIAMAIARILLPVGEFSSHAPWILVLVIGVAEWPIYARTLRATVLSERKKDYIQAARSLGLSGMRILWRHLIPNCFPPMGVLAATQLGGAILTEASLSFLGLGMPPNHPSLGSLIHEGFQFMLSGAWWMVAFPCLYLFALVLATNWLSDHLRLAQTRGQLERRIAA